MKSTAYLCWCAFQHSTVKKDSFILTWCLCYENENIVIFIPCCLCFSPFFPVQSSFSGSFSSWLNFLRELTQRACLLTNPGASILFLVTEYCPWFAIFLSTQNWARTHQKTKRQGSRRMNKAYFLLAILPLIFRVNLQRVILFMK